MASSGGSGRHPRLVSQDRGFKHIHDARQGIEDGLFGPSVVASGAGVSNAGRPRPPVRRLMIWAPYCEASSSSHATEHVNAGNKGCYT